MFNVQFVGVRQKLAFFIVAPVHLFNLKFAGGVVFTLLRHVYYALKKKKKFFIINFFKKKKKVIKKIFIKSEKLF